MTDSGWTCRDFQNRTQLSSAFYIPEVCEENERLALSAEEREQESQINNHVKRT